jgi:hypothetical protein
MIPTGKKPLLRKRGDFTLRSEDRDRLFKLASAWIHD